MKLRCRSIGRTAAFEVVNRGSNPRAGTEREEAMDRYNSRGIQRTSDPEIEVFLDEIEAVCRKHGMSISHEDGEGNFEITEFSETNLAWLRFAIDSR